MRFFQVYFDLRLSYAEYEKLDLSSNGLLESIQTGFEPQDSLVCQDAILDEALPKLDMK